MGPRTRYAATKRGGPPQRVKLPNEPELNQAGVEKCAKRSQKRTQIKGSVGGVIFPITPPCGPQNDTRPSRGYPHPSIWGTSEALSKPFGGGSRCYRSGGRFAPLSMAPTGSVVEAVIDEERIVVIGILAVLLGHGRSCVGVQHEGDETVRQALVAQANHVVGR